MERYRYDSAESINLKQPLETGHSILVNWRPHCGSLGARSNFRDRESRIRIQKKCIRVLKDLCSFDE